MVFLKNMLKIQHKAKTIQAVESSIPVPCIFGTIYTEISHINIPLHKCFSSFRKYPLFKKSLSLTRSLKTNNSNKNKTKQNYEIKPKSKKTNKVK